MLRRDNRCRLFLELLIEEIKWHWEEVAITYEEFLEIIDVSNQVANSLDLVFNNFFFQVMWNSDIIADGFLVLQCSVWVMTMDIHGSLQQCFFDFNSLSKSFNLTNISMCCDRSFVCGLERMCNSTFDRFFNQFKSLAPSSVRQTVQDLLKAGSVLGECSKLGWQEQVFVRSDEMVVCELGQVTISIGAANQWRTVCKKDWALIEFSFVVANWEFPQSNKTLNDSLGTQLTASLPSQHFLISVEQFFVVSPLVCYWKKERERQWKKFLDGNFHRFSTSVVLRKVLSGFKGLILTLLCLCMKLTLSSSAETTATKTNATKIDFMLFYNFFLFHWVFFEFF